MGSLTFIFLTACIVAGYVQLGQADRAATVKFLEQIRPTSSVDIMANIFELVEKGLTPEAIRKKMSFKVKMAVVTDIDRIFDYCSFLDANPSRKDGCNKVFTPIQHALYNLVEYIRPDDVTAMEYYANNSWRLIVSGDIRDVIVERNWKLWHLT